MTSTILPPGAVYALTDIRAHDVKYPGTTRSSYPPTWPAPPRPAAILV